MPIKYKVTSYDIFINGNKCNEALTDTDNVRGIIYPRQETTFRMKGVYFDYLQHKALSFEDIKKLKINNALKIEYSSSNDPGDIKEINRTFNWTILNNMLKLSWDKLDDVY